jgi:hypothetical protein
MEENIKTMITFLSSRDVEENRDAAISKAVNEIIKNFNLQTSIFLYERTDRPNSIFATYKAEIPTDQFTSPIENTKFINRNSKTNTFFTINALNRLCLKEIGVLDQNYKVKWRNYSNMLLMLKPNSKSGRTELIESPILQAGKVVINEDKTWTIQEPKGINE